MSETSRQHESIRLASLRALGLLDTPLEERFERVTRLAKVIFAVPATAITLVDKDRLWFKSRQGLAMTEMAREHAFCTQTVAQASFLVVEDASKDPRFCDNPMVVDTPNVRFYAGVPLFAPDGYCVGAFCIIDCKPRTLSRQEKETLLDLAAIVRQELCLRECEEGIALAEDAKRFYNLSPDLMCILRFDHSVKRVNFACQNLLGYTEEELLAKLCVELVHPEDRTATLLEMNALQNGRITKGFKNRVIGKDGTTHALSWNAAPFASEGLIYASAKVLAKCCLAAAQ